MPLRGGIPYVYLQYITLILYCQYLLSILCIRGISLRVSIFVCMVSILLILAIYLYHLISSYYYLYLFYLYLSYVSLYLYCIFNTVRIMAKQALKLCILY
jgi:hypothetical protein